MYWHRAKLSLLFSLLILATPSPAEDTSRLWLPTTYQTLYLPLKQAAHAAHSLERCKTILEGTIDLEQSRSGHIVFRILCRQEDGSSYIEMVDGHTFETLTTKPPEELTPEALALQRQAEQARQRAEREAYLRTLWQACAIGLSSYTQQMIDLVWVTPEPSKPTKALEESQERALTDGAEPNEETETLVFHRDFDAKDVWGRTLHYRALCQTEGPEELEIRIIPRPPGTHPANATVTLPSAF